MKPVYQTKKGKLYRGDCLEVLRGMPEQSVNCVVTSPPYWGLRDYGTGKWEGGDSDCEHAVGNQVQDNKAKGAIISGIRPGVDASICKKCGAVRVDQQLGLESMPEEYTQKMVEIFREVWRVLRDDGTVWLNIGDSYGAVGGDIYSDFNKRWSDTGGDGSKQNATLNGVKDRKCQTGLRPKNLAGIPWRVAFALQSDGWYLRQDIIWSKPNPMPESVKDRCTKSHEYIFLLSKSQKYYYDAEAIKEKGTEPPQIRKASRMGKKAIEHLKSVDPIKDRVLDGIRNKRSVWVINTMPYGGAHFAVFPSKLPKLCIKAGCPMGGTVLDPFFGSGTTGMVAQSLGRDWIGIELSAEYCKLVKERIPRAYQRSLLELCV